MKTHAFLMFLLAITTIFSCKKNEPKCSYDNVIPSEFKEYLPYNDGDQLYFQSTSGILDTLIVSKIYLDSLRGSRHECQNVYERLHCNILTGWKDLEVMQYNQEISLLELDGTSIKWISISGGNFQAQEGSSYAGINEWPAIDINGITYLHVLLANCINPAECSFIDSMCFVKNQGLIFYTINGEKRIRL